MKAKTEMNSYKATRNGSASSHISQKCSLLDEAYFASL